jgi:hypothetical protein
MFSRSVKLVAVLFVFALVLGLGLQPASAAASFASSAVTCSSFSATGTVTTAYVAVRVWNLTKGQSEGGPALIDSYAPVGAPTAYFAASGGAFSFTVNFPEQNAGDVIVARIYGTNTPAFWEWDSQAFPQVQVACQSGYAGPNLPNGFVLKTLTCNVAVYDAPAGKPVGGNAVTNGQTWFVNPTPKTGPDGQSWTEIFVAGYTNGFVPTRCVK